MPTTLAHDLYQFAWILAGSASTFVAIIAVRALRKRWDKEDAKRSQCSNQVVREEITLARYPVLTAESQSGLVLPLNLAEKFRVQHPAGQFSKPMDSASCMPALPDVAGCFPSTSESASSPDTTL